MNRYHNGQEPAGCPIWPLLDLVALCIIVYYALHWLGVL